MRTFISIALILSALIFINSCGGALNYLAPSGSSSAATGEPPAAFHENGVSLQILKVETAAEKIALTMRAINGKNSAVRLSEPHDAILLQDNLGNEYLSKPEQIELQPFTSNELRIEFAGALKSGANSLRLTTNAKNANEFGEPRLVSENIAAPGWSGSTDFEFAPRRPIALENASVNHQNGVSLTLNEIRFGEDFIEVGFLAVNGHDGEIKLANVISDNAFLQDEAANKYFLIPPANNREFSIPARQKMSGTLRFAGRVAPRAERLSLQFNSKYGGDNEYSKNPKIIVENLSIGK